MLLAGAASLLVEAKIDHRPAMIRLVLVNSIIDDLPFLQMIKIGPDITVSRYLGPRLRDFPLPATSFEVLLHLYLMSVQVKMALTAIGASSSSLMVYLAMFSTTIDNIICFWVLIR